MNEDLLNWLEARRLSWPGEHVVCKYYTACALTSHTQKSLSHRLPLDKTSYSTMSNPEVNVILLTSKLN